MNPYRLVLVSTLAFVPGVYAVAETIELKAGEKSSCEIVGSVAAREASDPTVVPTFPIKVEVSPQNRLMILRCHFSWTPIIPENTQVTGGELVVSGQLDADPELTTTFRWSHHLLGLGDLAPVVTKSLTAGSFTEVIPIQNLASISKCAPETKLTSNLTFLLKGKPAEAKSLLIDSISIKSLNYSTCPVEGTYK